MAGKLVNQGEVIMLKASVNHTAPQNLVMRLYKNDWTPAEGDTERAAPEADFTGYSAKTLAGASWTATPGAPSSIEYAAQEFASSANQATQNIYGWYLTQETSGLLVAAERFSSPLPFSTDVDAVMLTPVITLADSTD